MRLGKSLICFAICTVSWEKIWCCGRWFPSSMVEGGTPRARGCGPLCNQYCLLRFSAATARWLLASLGRQQMTWFDSWGQERGDEREGGSGVALTLCVVWLRKRRLALHSHGPAFPGPPAPFPSGVALQVVGLLALSDCTLSASSPQKCVCVRVCV